MKGDKALNHALDSRLERESDWTRKFSTVVAVDQMYQENVLLQNIQTVNNFDEHQIFWQ